MENGSQDRFEEIRRMKKHTSARSLCQDCPEELTDFIRYCRKLEFEQTPNYSYLRSLIRNAMGCGGVDVSDESASSWLGGLALVTTRVTLAQHELALGAPPEP